MNMNYDSFVFILCLCVFLILTLFVSSLLIYIFKLSKKLIQSGFEDATLIKEYKKNKRKKEQGKTVWDLIKLFFSASIVIVMCGLFAFSIFLKVAPEDMTKDFSKLLVVESNSMSYKRDENTYLKENNLNDQFSMFDIVVTHKLPAEEDLELYDIVVYNFDGTLVIHRIIEIEEPNAFHPDCRHFTLKGDANAYTDKKPVLYEQMVAIYQGEKVQFIGSFVLFLQSPAGYLSILLAFVTTIVVPLMGRKLEDEKELRLRTIGAIRDYNEKVVLDLEGDYDD